MKTSDGKEIPNGSLLRFMKDTVCYDQEKTLPWDGRYFKVFYKDNKLFRTGGSGFIPYVESLKQEDTILELVQEDIDKYDVRF